MATSRDSSVYRFEFSDHRGEVLHDSSSQKQHRLVNAFDKNHRKNCAYCSFHKIKTRAGWRINTNYICEACNIPLCKGERNCFYLYHKVLEEYGDFETFQKHTREMQLPPNS